MKNLIFLILLFGVTSCYKPFSKVDKISINALWEYDTCGTKGFRMFLSIT
jgi:hypothetical protein